LGESRASAQRVSSLLRAFVRLHGHFQTHNTPLHNHNHLLQTPETMGSNSPPPLLAMPGPSNISAPLPVAEVVSRRLEEMHHGSIHEAAQIFHRTVLELDHRAPDFDHWRQLLWQHARAFDLHKHLPYESYEDMLTQLDGVLPPNGRGHTARALGILIRIRHHWGPDFYKQIPLRQGPVGEKILSTLCRLAKSTTLASFAARIQLIVTDRVKTRVKRRAHWSNRSYYATT
jgi:hypothetical protein